MGHTHKTWNEKREGARSNWDLFYEDKKVENLSDGKCRCPETMSRGRRRRKGRTPDSPM